MPHIIPLLNKTKWIIGFLVAWTTGKDQKQRGSWRWIYLKLSYFILFYVL